MRPILLSATAASVNSPWAPINYLQLAFAIGLGAIPSSDSNLTFKVQHTFDDLERLVPVSISRSGTTATVTDPSHGLSTGDSVALTGTGSTQLEQPEGVDVTVVDVNTYTYTVANAGPAASAPGTMAIHMRVFDHTTITGATARVDGNYAFPVRAIRLKATAGTTGRVDLAILQGLGR